MNGVNKLIFKTAAVSLVAVAVVTCYAVGIFAFAFPKPMSNFADALGNKSMSAAYHERVYKRDKTNENLYFALDKFIIAEKHGKVITYFEKFYEKAEYASMVVAVSKYKEERATTITDPDVRALVCDEDNRLRVAYIRALVAKHDYINAKGFLVHSGDKILPVFKDYFEELLG